ncbi:MAG: L-lactate permease [Anaerolineae bacterium]|nr:L-lactate permease [Anaerolineae bacterium]
MHFDTLDWFLSLTPMLAVLGLMVGLAWNTNRAGLVGWLMVIALAAWRFGAGRDAIFYAQIKAFILTADVVLIIWAALVLYYVVERAGALAVISQALSSLTSNDLLQVLLLGWIFASFLQGMGGFGVPVAITAPLLIGLGVPQVRAVVIPSLGHGWAVTFGSLAASFVMLMNTTGIPGEKLAAAPAIMLGVLSIVSGLIIAHVFAGWRGVRRAIPFVLTVGSSMALAQYILATNGIWTIGAIGGGATGLAVAIVWIRWRGFAAPTDEGQRVSPSPAASTANPADTADTDRPTPTIRLAVIGYAVLVVLALLLRGIQPVKAALGQIALEVDLPATTTDRDWTVNTEKDAGFGIPGHPGLIILYSSLIAFTLYRRHGYYVSDVTGDILRQATRRAFRSGVGHYLMVAIGATMARSGMITIVADGLSRNISGDLYAFVAPVIGGIGAFVTGSNVNSNAVFSQLQLNTAEMLGLSVITILGAQTASAAVASVMSPAKVTVGCSTVGANEGVVMRWLLGYGSILVALVGVMTWIGLKVF